MREARDRPDDDAAPRVLVVGSGAAGLTTALGAAYAAGIAVGFWSGTQDVIDNWAEDKRWEPAMDEAERERLFRNWNKAVQRTLDWVDEDVVE